ncbi:putative minor tail T [Haemophilus haemolyticus M21127]|uniref:phage tail assembly protein T n=1 Tax=Haemophilus haemolyticus TaxID=726 RepID=UPI00021B4085|nr:phage tail assembly protein T [Haemophilus haemolyticus]EGT77663.1 putative minor tail T [Haemophilus haemolyticus M21127]
MLREISLAEYFSWYKYFGARPFTLEMLDYGYGIITSSVYNCAAAKQVVTARDFSIFNSDDSSKEMTDEEMTDEEMMEVSAANSGVLRIGPD